MFQKQYGIPIINNIKNYKKVNLIALNLNGKFKNPEDVANAFNTFLQSVEECN